MDRRQKPLQFLVLALLYAAYVGCGNLSKNDNWAHLYHSTGAENRDSTEPEHYYSDQSLPKDMYYPNELPDRSGNSSANIREAQNCHGDCQNTGDYPYNEIRQIVDQSPLLKQYFATQASIDIDTRFEEDGNQLCQIKAFTQIYPKKMKNIHDVEVIVVNDDKEYKQAVEYKRCASEGHQCRIPFEKFGYKTYCKQKFEKRHMMVYQNTTRKIVFDQFRVPSCCVCMVTQT